MSGRNKKERAREMRRAGNTLKIIAERLEVSVATVSNYCKGVMPKGANVRDRRRQQLMPEVAKRYKAGMPISRISRELGIPEGTLYEWRRRSGLKKNPRTVYVTDELKDRIRRKLSVDKDGKKRSEAVRLYTEEFWTTTEIAEKLQVTSVTISEWLEAVGVTRRRSPTARTRQKLRKANLGEKRYNWKGGVTLERIRLRTSLDMKLAREACFERDDYTCQSCGVRGGRLNAHHVWPFHRYPEKRYDVSNLMTLCRECHDAFHKAAGGHVRVAIGPFFWRPEDDEDDQVREVPALYEVSRQGEALAA